MKALKNITRRKHLAMKQLCALFLSLSLLAGSGEISTEEKEQLWIGSTSGIIAPIAEKLHKAPNGDTLTFLKVNGEEVLADDYWAISDRDELEIKEQSYRHTEKGFALQLKEIEEKKAENKKVLEAELRELDEEALKIKKLAELSPDDEFTAHISDALEKIEEKKNDLKEAFNLKYTEEKKAHEQEQISLGKARAKKEYQNYNKKAYLKAGVSGKIRYLIPSERFNKDDPHTLEITPNEDIMLIRNDEEVMVVIPDSQLERPLSLQKKYMGRAKTESGMIYTCFLKDSFTRVEKDKIKKYYRFLVNKGDLPTARQTIGEKALVDIFQQFPEKYTIIKKEELILKETELIQENGWESAVLSLFPHMKIQAVGKTAIALSKK